MSDVYKELAERAKNLASEMKDKLDNDDLPLARDLKEKSHDLKEHMEGGGDADNAQNQAKELAELFGRAADQSGDQAPMNSSEASEFKEQYMELREDLRAI